MQAAVGDREVGVERVRSRDGERAGHGDAAADPGFEAELERARALERTGAIEAAIDAYRDMARGAPQRREPLQGLRRLYSERGSWDAVLQVAELEIGLLGQPDERARLLTQMARIWERELGEPDQARQLLARAAEERARSNAQKPAAGAQPASGQTLVQRAWLAAARGDSQNALAALHDALAADPSDVEALDMMLTVLEGAERYGEMSDLLERRAAVAADLGTRAVVLARLGALREAQQGDPGGARSAYERALEADPANRAARSALQRIYRKSESWSALRTLLEGGAASGAPQDRAATYVALGALLERQLGDSRGAEQAYRSALALAPDDSDAQAGIARLKGERRRGGGTSRSESAPQPRDAGAAAQPEPSAAEAAKPRSREHAAADDAQAAAQLREIARDQGDVDALIPLLREELMRSAPEQELALQRELAELLAPQGGAALPHARRAAALAPRDHDLLERALTAAKATGSVYAALDLLDDLLASAPDLATRAQLLACRGDTLQDQLGWTVEALHSWREALEADPRHAGARARLAQAQL